MSDPLGTPGSPKSLPLILARELASNLATPMFLLDAGGMLVFYNDAAAKLLGKSFAELGRRRPASSARPSSWPHPMVGPFAGVTHRRESPSSNVDQLTRPSWHHHSTASGANTRRPHTR